MGLGITWYEVLGVLPGASAQEIQREYQSKAGLLRVEYVAGEPSSVVTAASRAQRILDAALHVLGDPASRERYDEMTGVRRLGGGLVRPESVPSEPGWDPSEFDFTIGKEAELVGGLMALTDWLAPHPQPPRRVIAPDVRGLFYSVCLDIVGKLHLRVTAVRLTEHPMPVDGLVVAQSPPPSAKMRRSGELTVQVWHPPARAADAR